MFIRRSMAVSQSAVMGPSVLATLLLVSLIGYCRPATILLLSSVPTVSHSLWYNKLARLLSENNHQVVILDTTDKMKTNAANVTHYVLDGGYEYEEDVSHLEALAVETSPKLTVDFTTQLITMACTNMLQSKTARKFLDRYKGEEKPFDLIIHDGTFCESFLGFVHHFGYPPLIVATTYGEPLHLLHFVGNYNNPSYVPIIVTPFPPPFSFKQRLYNTALSLYEIYVLYVYQLPAQNQIAKRFFGPDTPPVEEIGRSTSLVLLNSHFSISGAKPTVPAVVYIGGFHIEPPKLLKQDIKSFLDGAEHGAIYMSLGTVILSSNMGAEKRDMFLDAFRELPQRVLWKWETDSVPNKPDNVMLSKWFSQSDVLAHPQVRLFISHGGILGSQEAIHRGVPIIAMPFAFDQHANALKLDKTGAAVRLDYATLTKEILKKTIEAVLKNESYSKKMKEWSRIFRDGPDTPQSRALFWIEYVLRHPKSTYMRSPTVDMPIYQILFLDIALFISLVLGGSFCILYFLVKWLFRTPRKGSLKQKRQ